MRLGRIIDMDANKKVSIHASVKDATSSDNAIKMSGLVSIHASVKDATLPILMLDTVGGFNPRICKRCDLRLRQIMQEPQGFNPRICKRCDYEII